MNLSANINYSDLLTKHREKVVLLAVIILSLVVSKNIYKKQMGKYEKLKGDIKAEKEKGETLDRIVLFTEKIKKMKTRGWENQEINKIVEKISGLALQSHVRFKDVTPQEKRDERHYILIPLALTCEATYKDFYSFLKALETYPHFIRIASFGLSSAEGDPLKMAKDGPLLRVGCVIEAVYFKS